MTTLTAQITDREILAINDGSAEQRARVLGADALGAVAVGDAGRAYWRARWAVRMALAASLTRVQVER